MKLERSIMVCVSYVFMILTALFKDLPLLLDISGRSYSLDGDVIDAIGGNNGDD